MYVWERVVQKYITVCYNTVRTCKLECISASHALIQHSTGPSVGTADLHWNPSSSTDDMPSTV